MSRLLTALLVIASTGCGLKDLRPQSLRKDGPTVEQRDEGRALLEQAVAATGGWDRWRRLERFTFSATDTWDHLMGELAFLTYDKAQTFDMVAVGQDVDNLRMTLTNGKKAGQVWGYRDGKGYLEGEGLEGKEPKPLSVLFVKTTAALLGLPMRLGSADHVALLGEVDVGGTRYHEVFLTWDQLDPTETYDHWVVYVHPETHRIDYAQFTVREYEAVVAMPVARKGFFAMSDYRDVEGLQIPHRIDALLNIDRKPVHSYDLRDVQITLQQPASPDAAAATEL
ncbi:MAG: hypothetical protein KTR31_07900 [Myxococcales bacterium]|nr:hypothetical protein [Myxococcales bacterium]